MRTLYKREIAHLCRTEDLTLSELLQEHTEHETQFIWLNRTVRDANGIPEPVLLTLTSRPVVDVLSDLLHFKSTLPLERQTICLTDRMNAVWNAQKIPNLEELKISKTKLISLRHTALTNEDKVFIHEE